MGEWQRVVFADECSCDLDCNECEVCEELRCAECGGRYADCPCPGPTQDDEFEYRGVNGHLEARRRVEVEG